MRSRVGVAKMSAANAKSNPRSARFRSLFAGSQVKRTKEIYYLYIRARKTSVVA
jgi:hypothetical protein